MTLSAFRVFSDVIVPQASKVLYIKCWNFPAWWNPLIRQVFKSIGCVLSIWTRVMSCWNSCSAGRPSDRQGFDDPPESPGHNTKTWDPSAPRGELGLVGEPDQSLSWRRNALYLHAVSHMEHGAAADSVWWAVWQQDLRCQRCIEMHWGVLIWGCAPHPISWTRSHLSIKQLYPSLPVNVC